MFLWSLQYGIVVLGFLDACVYAHHKHRLDSASAGDFGDCLRGRVRFMTAITPAYAHAYQAICLAMHFPGVPRRSSDFPNPSPDIHIFPMIVPLQKNRAMIIMGGLFIQMVVLALWMVKTFAGWSVISRSPRGRIFVLFGPVITHEAHLACSGARTHSHNTIEMTAMIDALSFLGSRGPVTHDEQSCIFYDSMHAAGICLGTMQARTHVQLALACQQSIIRVQHRPRLTMQHVYGHGGNLGNECADHAAALGTFGLI